MKVDILSTGMGYVAKLVDEATGDDLTTFEIEDVEKVPWGLAATVTVRTRIAGAHTLSNGFVTHERINLSGGKYRKEFGDRLATLIPKPPSTTGVGWDRVVDEVALLVMEAENRPPTLIDLSTVTARTEETFLIPGLLPVGKSTILYGAGGTGKSILAIALGACVQAGVSFAGWPVEQANVLYLDWETDPADIAHRLSLVSAGLGLKTPTPMRYLSLVSPLTSMQSAVATICASEKIGLVIIDSVGMATAGARDGGDMAEGAIRFFRGLRALKASVLAIDHISGDDLKRKAGASKPFGSVFKLNSARNAFELRNTTDTLGHRVTLIHQKNNLGPKMADTSFRVEWGEERVRFRKDAYVLTTRPTDERIEEALTIGPVSVGKLVELLNDSPSEDAVSEYEVRMTLLKMRSEDRIAIEGTGLVRLAQEEAEVPDDQPQLGLANE